MGNIKEERDTTKEISELLKDMTPEERIRAYDILMGVKIANPLRIATAVKMVVERRSGKYFSDRIDNNPLPISGSEKSD